MKKHVLALALMLLVDSSSGQQFTDLTGDYLGQTPPGDTPKVFAPDVVSTIFMEHSTLAISPDGNEVFWWVRPGPEIDSSFYNPDTWISFRGLRRIGNRWTVRVGSKYGGGPAFSPDGKRLYFSSLPPYDRNDGPYYVENQDGSWSEPRNTGLVERFPYLRSIQGPTVTHDETLYFAADTAGLGMLQHHVIYRSKKVDGVYTRPEMLPACINVPGSWNFTPFIAHDESYLIFSSNRPGSLDRYGDLYISFHDSGRDTWSAPVSLGKPINTPGQESSPGVSPDGKYLFYTGPVDGHQADVFWVSAEVIYRLRAQQQETHRRP